MLVRPRHFEDPEDAPEPIEQPGLISEQKLETEPDADADAEAYIAYIFAEAKKAKDMEFDTEEEATAYYDAFMEAATERLHSLEKFNHTIFRISGPGVNVPDLGIGPVDMDEKESVLAVMLNDSELKPLDMFKAIDVRFQSVLASTNQNDETEKFNVDVQLIMTSAEPEVMHIGTEAQPLPAAMVYVYPNYLVECDDTTTIEIPELVEKRASQALAHELARNGLSASIFGKKLGELRGIFGTAHDTDYVEFPDMQLLRDLGKLSNERARNGASEADLLSRAILDAVGKDRLLEVSGTPLGHEDEQTDIITSGRVIDVLMPDSDSDDIEPTVVIESLKSDLSTTVIYRYPFTRISSMRF